MRQKQVDLRRSSLNDVRSSLGISRLEQRKTNVLQARQRFVFKCGLNGAAHGIPHSPSHVFQAVWLAKPELLPDQNGAREGKFVVEGP